MEYLIGAVAGWAMTVITILLVLWATKKDKEWEALNLHAAYDRFDDDDDDEPLPESKQPLLSRVFMEANHRYGAIPHHRDDDEEEGYDDATNDLRDFVNAQPAPRLFSDDLTIEERMSLLTGREPEDDGDDEFAMMQAVALTDEEPWEVEPEPSPEPVVEPDVRIVTQPASTEPVEPAGQPGGRFSKSPWPEDPKKKRKPVYDGAGRRIS